MKGSQILMLYIFGVFLGAWLGQVLTFTRVQTECRTAHTIAYTSWILQHPLTINCTVQESP